MASRRLVVGMGTMSCVSGSGESPVLAAQWQCRLRFRVGFRGVVPSLSTPGLPHHVYIFARAPFG
ncbi:hypothetical protein C5B89_17360 [Haloferax sp. Atlit-47N]|nr:hypothetical protein DEQ67_13740 [Haloferax sp. Atlit-48N]RDZ33670.1 hypothetical protein C5B88_17910 [Haloferax sp. Atlit-24N]RDZ36006.1 hypothetical protein C5B89_17360 [Haloferax sp. Atlit-47N]RLM34194.1 hypothetical protein DVK03_16690 [Haloferax sp. Atlit-109R]RLM41016.1 hypothetical protein DVK04_16505 [Haloferax sp. Atlit-105R]